AASEMELAFSGLADLVRPVAAAVATLPDVQRRGLEVALLVSEGPAPDERLLGSALLGLIETAAASSRVLLAVDDLHWLDRPSAAVLAFALRRLEGPVSVLLA